MRLAAAWAERFTSRRDVGHFLAWLPDLREFQVLRKVWRALSSVFKKEHTS
jgi:hypothetical protein